MGGSILTKIKAKYIGDWDPEYEPGQTYDICDLPEYPNGDMVAAYNSHGEAYVMPKKLFAPTDS